MSGTVETFSRLAVVLLKLPDGRFVFQRRTLDAPVGPGLLGLFGGHMEPGESPDECIRREMAEETSLDIGSLKITPVEEFEFPPVSLNGKDRYFYLYETEIEDDGFEVFEGVRAETYTAQEALARNDMSDASRRALEKHAS